MTGLLVDTGFLVALFRRNDRLRVAARAWLAGNRAPLLTVAPVIVETSFFLDPREKCNLLEWITRGALAVHEIPGAAYPLLRWLIEKYADRDPDMADIALLWLAQTAHSRRLLTVDIQDFTVYRTKGGHALELVKWLPA